MKWHNKGHEFDELGYYLCKVDTVYLWGAGVGGNSNYERFVWLGIEKDFNIIFVDSDPNKQGTLFCNKRVISPADFIDEFRDNGKMVLLISIYDPKALYGIYTTWGFEDNTEICQGKNCFASTENRTQIRREFFSVLMMYKYDKLLSTIQDIIATTKCTLNCNRCLNYTMFNKRRRHFPLKMLKDDVDVLFSKADYVDMLNISGGEILMHDGIAELIDYIGETYRNRIFEFLLITNGTIIPSETVLEKIAKNKCLVRLDDYRDTVPLCREQLPRITESFDKHNIDYYVFRVSEWINVAHDSTINFYMNDEKLIKYFDLCESPCKYIRDGKLYGCNYHAFAVEAGIARELESDFIIINDSSKREIFEFLLGYSDKGYVDYCKHCSGYFTINRNKISPAEQI